MYAAALSTLRKICIFQKMLNFEIGFKKPQVAPKMLKFEIGFKKPQVALKMLLITNCLLLVINC